MGPTRRQVLAGAGLGITSLVLPHGRAAASTSTPAALVGADAFAFASPGYVDLVADMSGSVGTATSISGHEWHLGYAFQAISIDGFRVFGASDGENTTSVRYSIAPDPGVVGGFPDATQISISPAPEYATNVELARTFTAFSIPAGHHFLIALQGGNVARARVDSAPSRIATAGGQSVVGFETGSWFSNHWEHSAAILGGFTEANRNVGAMDRVGWRVTVTA